MSPAWIGSALAIVGGEPSVEPAIVAVGSECTGTLVAEDVVVFAAHCGAIERIRFGPDLDGPAVEVSHCATHPDGLDLAWCRLASPVQDKPLRFAEEVDPAALGRVIGFGVDERGQRQQRAGRTGLSCVSPAGEILTTGIPADGCSGDSGGPLLVWEGEWRVAGVLSRSGACGTGARYIHASTVASWLSSELGQTVPGPPLEHTTVAPPRVVISAIRRTSPERVEVDLSIADTGCGLGWTEIAVDGQRRGMHVPHVGLQTVTIPLPEGTHELSLSTTDRAGNRVTTEASTSDSP